MLDEPIFAFDCGTPECRPQPADAARFSEYLWRWCNSDRRRIEARRPHELCPVAAQLRIGRETRAPRGASVALGTRLGRVPVGRLLESRGCNWDFGAGIPKRARRG